MREDRRPAFWSKCLAGLGEAKAKLSVQGFARDEQLVISSFAIGLLWQCSTILIS
jgi:hypothetical protein